MVSISPRAISIRRSRYKGMTANKTVLCSICSLRPIQARSFSGERCGWL